MLANVIVPVLRNYAAVAGISFSRVPTENIARFDYCFAHDQLITLATLDKTGAMPQRQRAPPIGIGAIIFSVLPSSASSDSEQENPDNGMD